MYAMIHSAENVYRQQAADMNRDLERQRRRAESPAADVAQPNQGLRHRATAAMRTLANHLHHGKHAGAVGAH